jgi:hypothetical protein
MANIITIPSGEQLVIPNGQFATPSEGLPDSFPVGATAIFEDSNPSVASIGSAVTMIDANRAIVCYRDQAGAQPGKVRILTISGTNISVGDPVTFNASSTSKISVCLLDSTYAVVSYESGSDVFATLLTISGSTITPGSTVTVTTAFDSDICTMDSTHAMLVYNNSTGGVGGAICVTRSGSTLSTGSEITFDAAIITKPSVCSLDSTNAVVCYRSNTNTGRGCHLSLSGAVVSSATPIDVNTATLNYITVQNLDSTRAVVAYTDVSGGSDWDIAANVLTLSGTLSAGIKNDLVTGVQGVYLNLCTLTSSSGVIAYNEDGNNGKAALLDIFGSNVIANTPFVFNADPYMDNDSCMVPVNTTQALVAYNDESDSYIGKANILTPPADIGE